MPSHVPVWLKTGPYLGAIVFDGEAWAERMWANTVIPELTFNPPYHTPPITISQRHLSGRPRRRERPPRRRHVDDRAVPLAYDRITALVRTGAGYTEATPSSTTTGPARGPP